MIQPNGDPESPQANPQKPAATPEQALKERELALKEADLELQIRKWDEERPLRQAHVTFETSTWRRLAAIAPLGAAVPAALAAVLAAVLSYRTNLSAQRAVSKAESLGTFVAAGSVEFKNPIRWHSSSRVAGWLDEERFVPLSGIACKKPLAVSVSFKSVDSAAPLRAGVAAPDKERTNDGFMVVVYTWGDVQPVWMEVAWVAYCPRD